MKVLNPLTPGDQLPGLLERIERREKSALSRGVLYSLVPVALTVLLLLYTVSSVQNAQKQVDSLRAEASSYTTQIDALKKNADNYQSQSHSLQGDAENYKGQVTELQAQLADTQKTLSETVNLGRAMPSACRAPSVTRRARTSSGSPRSVSVAVVSSHMDSSCRSLSVCSSCS